MVLQSISAVLKIGMMLLLAYPACAQKKAQPQYLDLTDAKRWRVEFEVPTQSAISYDDGAVVLASYGGATLWLDSALHGDYAITYERMILLDSGTYDRVSDLNQFWLASEPDEPGRLDQKDGKLSSYDSLSLFYVGMGGNYNSTTRFRRYDGAGNRVLLDEKNEAPFLLLPNVYYRVKTIVSKTGGFTSFYVNDVLFFSYKGALPAVGFFGFRQTASRQKIRNVRISAIH